MSNEFDISINGNEYTLKPTWETIKNIENTFDTSLIELSNKIPNGQFKISEIVEFIFVCLKGDKNPPKRTDIGDDLTKKGVAKYLTIIGEFISCSFLGSDEYADATESVKEEGN